MAPARSTSRSSAGASTRGRLGHQSKPEPLQIVRAEGSHVYDAKGKRYLDLTSGWCVGNLGWARPALRVAVRRERRLDYASPHFEYAPWDELAEQLCAVAPGRMRTAFRATGGSEAVDLALQAAMLATGRTKFVSLKDAYHGNTLAGLAVAGSAPKGVLPGSKQVKPPFDENSLGRVETLLKTQRFAAFILEPIAINLGIEIPEPEFMHGLEQLCKEHGTLLIADEVATGFGRTGKMFASEHYDLEPDMVCLAKGLTSGAAPMGALLTTKQVADEVEEDFTCYSTYGWHPLSTAGALASLAEWRRDGKRILRNVEERSAQLHAALEEMDLGDEAEIKIKGLAAGVHLGDEKRVSRIADACRKRGVLVSPSDDVLQVLPPLTVTEDELDQGLAVLRNNV